MLIFNKLVLNEAKDSSFEGLICFSQPFLKDGERPSNSEVRRRLSLSHVSGKVNKKYICSCSIY
jgi:hypothetical protein